MAEEEKVMEYDENRMNEDQPEEEKKEQPVTEEVVETEPVKVEPINIEPIREAVVTEPPVKKNKGKVKHFLGRVAVLIASGLLFGLCAAVAFGLVNYYTEKSFKQTEESADDLKKRIEDDIMSRIDDRRPPVVFEDTEKDEQETSYYVTDVSQVAEKVMPSVVSIKNTYTVKTNFWGSYYETEQEASGSGIIFGENDEELLLATNYHVIQDAEKLEVQFIDGEVVEAHVKGFDSDMDVAVIAVEYKELEPSTKDAIEVAELGDSDALKVGEPAIAIGNALGYGQSVTTGVISALDRKLEISEGVMSEGFIQTDAAINPGNSGGALLNAKVIGINSNKIGGSTIEGMGYAIPISKAGPILDELKNKKTMTEVSEKDRGYLGIQGRGVSSEMSEIYGFPEGVYVYEVYPGTGAEAAKLRKGDIITKFDGSTVDSMETLQGYLAYYKAGEVVELTIMRTGADGVYEENKVEVKLVSKSVMPKD